MRKLFLKIFLGYFVRVLLLVLFPFNYSHAQTAAVHLDSTSILIGQQVTMRLELSHPLNKNISWAEIPDTISKIEVLAKSAIDTVFSPDSSFVTRKQTLTLTCFDSGYYAIPPFRFVDKNNPDSLTNFTETLPVLLAVHTVEVDTTQAIRDIKAIVPVPFSWKDVLPYLLYAWIVAGIILLIYYLYKRKKRKPEIAVRKIPTRPAHEIALEELRKLEEEKLWQQGNFKEYHTRITDTIRMYIEHRWNVAAMEMTTDEILNYPVIYKLRSENISQLRYMLELADFVKFAKLIPVAHENEQSIKHAYDFVLDTRISVRLDKDDEAEKPEKERKEEAAL